MFFFLNIISKRKNDAKKIKINVWQIIFSKQFSFSENKVAR